MIDLSIWRVLLLGVPIAVILAMFSLEDVIGPQRASVAGDTFDGAAAAQLSRELSSSASAPTPGSEAEMVLGELVKTRFAAIEGATLSQQRFRGSFDGEEVDLRNLIVVLPGQSNHQIALIAGRDVRAGSGATSSIPATAIMLEIAAGFAGATHEKTLVFVSTDGGSLGALGARRFVRDYTDADLLDAVVVVSEPASAKPIPPLVVATSTGPQNTSAQLERTTRDAISQEVGMPAGDPGPLTELFRLALPAGFGDQAPLIESGIEAIRLSSAGELPAAEPTATEQAKGSAATIGNFGRATLSVLLALDQSPPPVHGPATRVGLAGNVLPGWSLEILAISLLLPGLAVGLQAVGRSAHRPENALTALGWVLLRALPFVAVVFAARLLAIIGAVPDPLFPFDPASESPHLGGAVAIIALLIAGGATAWFTRPAVARLAPALDLARATALLLATVASLAIWISNPYLALLLALGLNAWVLAASLAPAAPRWQTFALLALGILPLGIAMIDLASRLGSPVGVGFLWDLLLMLTGDQIPFGAAILCCVLAGCCVALASRTNPIRPPRPIVFRNARSEFLAPGGPS